jgi:hypothetical protein
MTTETVPSHASLVAEMAEAFNQLEHPPLRAALLEAVTAERDAVSAIGASFERFTGRRHPPEIRRTFFASWQKTNNSAMSVEGLANRITDQAESGVEQISPGRSLALFRAAGRLNRVTDEDLGVGGQILHFELYYRMATGFTDDTDEWQSRKHCLPAATDFKSWLDGARLRDPIMVGLYSMLVHEGYTHAELETIAPLFERWATVEMGLPARDARKLLAWIAVHNGGTEKRHFAHACAALEHYCAATGEEVDLDIAAGVFRDYLRRKSAVMQKLDEVY